MNRGVYLYDHETQRVLPKDEVLALRAQRRAARNAGKFKFRAKPVERGCWVYDPRTGELVPKHLYRRETRIGLEIVKDIEPYKNIVDGGVIGGRKQHKDFMRARGLVEIGNEKVEKQYEPPPGLRDDLKRALNEVHGDL